MKPTKEQNLYKPVNFTLEIPLTEEGKEWFKVMSKELEKIRG